jgi:hypothetical protein
MSKIKVDAIKITIGRKTLELTPDELKELRDILDATFPKATVQPWPAPVIIERPVYREWPYRRWHEPFWSDTTAGGGKILSLTCQRPSPASVEG